MSSSPEKRPGPVHPERFGEHEPDQLDAALQEAETRIAALEAFHAPRAREEAAARSLLSELIKQRKRVQQRGVPMWDGAQRAALRMVLLAIGAAAVICGAMAFDGTLGTVAIFFTLVLLMFEGLR